MHRVAGDIVPIERDRALLTGDKADDHVKAGGLARTVWSQQPDDFTFVHVKADTIDGALSRIIFDKSFSSEQGHRRILLTGKIKEAAARFRFPQRVWRDKKLWEKTGNDRL